MHTTIEELKGLIVIGFLIVVPLVVGLTYISGLSHP
jgi:hypothetical protein